MYAHDSSSDKSASQSNNVKEDVLCNEDDPVSTGTGSYVFICRKRLAATKITVTWDEWAGGDGRLAEVLIVGSTWGKCIVTYCAQC